MNLDECKKNKEVYEVSETMKLIGEQSPYIINEEILNYLKDIAKARPGAFTLEAALDIFTLGYIYRRN